MNFEVIRVSKSTFDFIRFRAGANSLKECMELAKKDGYNNGYFKTLNSKHYVKDIVFKIKHNVNLCNSTKVDYDNRIVIHSVFDCNKIYILTFDWNTIHGLIHLDNVKQYHKLLNFVKLYVEKGEFDFLKIGQKACFYLQFKDSAYHSSLEINFNF